MVNANYEFIMLHTGTNGKASDGGVLHETRFYEKLMKGSLKLPAPETPDGIQCSLPFTFIADEAFPLLGYLLKPYPQRGLSREERILNYRLSRARRIVEDAFCIMASRFRVFHTDSALDVPNIDTVVLACCVLHNYLRCESTNYSPSSYVDQEEVGSGPIILGEWRNGENHLIPLQRTARTSTAFAKQVRVEYKNYFNNEGSVPFQEKMAFNSN
jgi:hypothetical protein